MSDYKLLDSGEGRKLEKFGPYVLLRPAAQAVWKRQKGDLTPDASFSREGTKGWEGKTELPENWVIEVSKIRFKLSKTDFGHLGIFPEQAPFWEWMQENVSPGMEVLNLFAYSGGSTLACAKGGASVCHLDASKGMVDWARENARLNGLDKAPIRWIVEDVSKFLKREIKRGKKYDGIILDPPSFGRGAKGEVFKIDEEIIELLGLCRDLLKPHPKFLLFSCHTPGFSPLVMNHLLTDAMQGLKGSIKCGEMFLEGDRPLPSGTFAKWESNG